MINNERRSRKTYFIIIFILLYLMTGKVVFEGSDSEDDKELVIIEKKLDTFEKSTNNTVYPPFLAYSMSSNEEVKTF